jgi:hypothetical protein
MSKPRFSAEVQFDTLVHVEQVKTTIQSQVAGLDIFELHHLRATVDEVGNPTLFAEWRFNQLVDRDAFKNWVLNHLRNDPVVKTWVTKFRVEWHRCTHDEVNALACTTTDFLGVTV